VVEEEGAPGDEDAAANVDNTYALHRGEPNFSVGRTKRGHEGERRVKSGTTGAAVEQSADCCHGRGNLIVGDAAVAGRQRGRSRRTRPYGDERGHVRGLHYCLQDCGAEDDDLLARFSRGRWWLACGVCGWVGGGGGCHAQRGGEVVYTNALIVSRDRDIASDNCMRPGPALEKPPVFWDLVDILLLLMFQLIAIILYFYILCGDVFVFMSNFDPPSICSVRFGSFSSSHQSHFQPLLRWSCPK
jgi:hypothetical protein